MDVYLFLKIVIPLIIVIFGIGGIIYYSSPLYKIHKEVMGGTYYFMIYRKHFWYGWIFYERWNTPDSARIRLSELIN